MKVALLTDGIHPYVIGGMQQHSYFITKFLARNGVYVDLYHTWQNKEQDIHALSVFSADEKKFIRSFVIDFPKTGSLPGHYLTESYQYSVRIFNELKKNLDVDFIYVKGFAGWKLVEEKKKGMKLPPVGIKFHGMNMYQRPSSFREKLEQYMLRPPVQFNMKNADYVFSYGGKITDIIKKAGIPTEKIVELPTGTEVHWINSTIKRVEKRRSFVFIGRYQRLKGIEELMKVLKEIDNSYDFEFNFIGPIPEKLRSQSSKIKYWGQITDPDKIKAVLQQCDVLVCPSYSEGMPNVILEAMAQGLAVIATDVGAVNLLVSENNGWLIKSPQTENIKHALLDVIQIDKANIEQRKKNAVESVQKLFLWDKIIISLIEKLTYITKK